MVRKSTVILAAAVIASAVEFVFAFIYAWGMTSSDAVLRVGRYLHWPSSLLTDWIIDDGKSLRLRHEFVLNVALQFGLLFCIAILTLTLLVWVRVVWRHFHEHRAA